MYEEYKPRTCQLVGDLLVLHPRGLRLLRVERHVLLADALHVLVVGVLGVGLDLQHRAAGGTLHRELPYLGAVVRPRLVLGCVEAGSLRRGNKPKRVPTTMQRSGGRAVRGRLGRRRNLDFVSIEDFVHNL